MHPLPPLVRAALMEGRTLDAIRLLREAQGIGLKEAKEAVDTALRDGMPVAPPGLSPGEQPRGRGRLAGVLFVLLLLGLVAWLKL
jgi:hypothetical protein